MAWFLLIRFDILFMVKLAQDNLLESRSQETAPAPIIAPDQQFLGTKLDRLIRQNEAMAQAIAAQNTAIASVSMIVARRFDNLEAFLGCLDKSSPPIAPLPQSLPNPPQPLSPFLANRNLQQKEMDAGLLKLLSRPTEMAVDLSTRCNLQCIMCHSRIRNQEVLDFPWQNGKKSKKCFHI